MVGLLYQLPPYRADLPRWGWLVEAIRCKQKKRQKLTAENLMKTALKEKEGFGETKKVVKSSSGINTNMVAEIIMFGTVRDRLMRARETTLYGLMEDHENE